MRIFLFLSLFIISASFAVCQNQLVLIKNDVVQRRYLEGDDISYRRKSGKQIIKGFIVEITDSTLVTNTDTVATHQLERIYFSKGNFLNLVGGFLVFGGVAIFVIDQANNLIVNGQDPSLDSNVSTISLTSLAIGLPMFLIKKGSHRVGFKQRLRIINEESPFYYSESRFQPKGYQSPHIPRN